MARARARAWARSKQGKEGEKGKVRKGEGEASHGERRLCLTCGTKCRTSRRRWTAGRTHRWRTRSGGEVATSTVEVAVVVVVAVRSEISTTTACEEVAVKEMILFG